MKILAMVMAGGNGTRLHPLTAEHAKPALMFAAGCRIVDFVLGNLVNSRVFPIYVLAQYKPRSLIEHIETAWSPWSAGRDPAIRVVLPETRSGAEPYKGTADAIYRNVHLIERHEPDLVAVFAADHVYRMDVRQMATFHEQRGADVTIAAVRVPIAQASAFGIMSTGPAGDLREFREKPEVPSPIPTDPAHAYASMGNYLFDPRVLAGCWRRPTTMAPRTSVATSCRSCRAGAAHGPTTLRATRFRGPARTRSVDTGATSAPSKPIGLRSATSWVLRRASIS